MWIPITTCTKRLKNIYMKDWMYLAVASSQIQPVSQMSNLLYNGKGPHKIRYKLSFSCYIQIFSWEQHLISYTEINIDLVFIIITFLPCLNFNWTSFSLLCHIFNFKNPYLSSLNQMQTINQINWRPQFLTKHQFLWTESTAILHTYINSKLKKRKKFHLKIIFEIQFNK